MTSRSRPSTPTSRPVSPNRCCRARTCRHVGEAESGFTLLELLIVLVIIGLLAALVAPQYLDRLESSKITTTNAQIRMLKASLDTMRLDIGRYPTTQEGLAMLVDPPGDPALRGRWHGPYLESSLPSDAWGHPYNYTYTGTGNPPFALYSHGDASDTTSKSGKDIGINPPG
jgi:general secretion pathway protein G